MGVFGVHGAAVLNGHRAGHPGAIQLSDDGADFLAHLVGLLRCGGLTGSDRPERLVGDDHMAHLLGGHAGQSGLDLKGDQLHGDAQLPLLQALAHADDGVQAGVDGGVDLFVDGQVGLVPVLAALRVADDDVLDAQILEHSGGHFAGVSAALLKVKVLGADGDAGILKRLDRGGDVDKGNAQNDVAPFGLGHQGLELVGERPGLGCGLVHLPVSGNDGLAVSTIHGNSTSFSCLKIYVTGSFDS